MIELANLEAQGGLIKAALMEPKFRALILSKLSETDFWGADRELFRIVKANSAILPDTLSDEANERLLKLEGVLHTSPLPEHVHAWISEIENTRALIHQKMLLQNQLVAVKPGAKAEDIASATVSGMVNIGGQINTRVTYTMTDIVDEGLDLYERWQKGETSAGLVPTGIEPLDRMLGGMLPGHVTTLGGGSSQAKTTIALQIMRNIALRDLSQKRNSIAVFLSLDMGPTMLGFRLASSMSSVNWIDVRKNVPGVNKSAWVEKLKSLKDLPLTVKKMPYPTPDQLMNQIELEAAGHSDGISLVIVDYIEMMKGEGSNETAQVSNVMIGLKVIAERYGCPVLALSQIAREAMKSPARMPEKFHLRQSGMIENLSQAILLCYYPAGYQTTSQAETGQWPNEALKTANDKLAKVGANYLIKIEKNRDDESGIGVPLFFEPHYTRVGAPDALGLARMRKAA